MTRQLSTERPFLVMTDVDAHPLLDAYRIMNAVMTSFSEVDVPPTYGTVIGFSTSEQHFHSVAHCSCRFFGILLKEDGSLVIFPKSKYVTGAKLESAYLGIPTEHTKLTCPEGFWAVTYPHITIVPPNHKIHQYARLLREFNYSYSELISTENTYSHHVLIGDESHHITRMVRNGMKPVIAGKEIVHGTHYENVTGYAVLM
jgi:hypothetical protein